VDVSWIAADAASEPHWPTRAGGRHRLGHVDILVNNAGAPGVRAKSTRSRLGQGDELNIRGVFLLTRPSARQHDPRRYGRSSTSPRSRAVRNPPDVMSTIAYNTSKVPGQLHARWRQSGPHNITVNAWPGLLPSK